MATIKPIEGRSVHQIQSGQVIVDLCSVVKELVENSLDAGATSIEVRLKTNGLDAIEVQDNGDGITPENYETIALKHYTSKLSEYADLSTLQTFGFRGEALSSLCALSTFTITTARADEAPKGTRLSFETSGKLRDQQVVACQKGTTVSVENLFQNLPVRRRELEKNVKREYGKALTLLQAYACISTGVRFVVSNQMAKGKRATVFATKSNPTTKENLANVYGAKTLLALVPLSLTFELEYTRPLGQRWNNEGNDGTRTIHIQGHISRPSFGEGRQTPDRQMFFVNARPCGLPQVAKAFNEVYKSYNLSQSPFIFADLKMDTNSYDVNVSPDKRTILLHDQARMLESLKGSLTALFEAEDQTVPQSQLLTQKQPAFRQLTINREATAASDVSKPVTESEDDTEEDARAGSEEDDHDRDNQEHPQAKRGKSDDGVRGDGNLNANPMTDTVVGGVRDDEPKDTSTESNSVPSAAKDVQHHRSISTSDDNSLDADRPPGLVKDFNRRIAEQVGQSPRHESPVRPTKDPDQGQSRIPSISPIAFRPAFGVVQDAFDRVRSRRTAPETATITIGSHTTTSPIGTPPRKRQRVEEPGLSKVDGTGATVAKRTTRKLNFAQGLRSFAAPGTQQVGSDDADASGSEDEVAPAETKKTSDVDEEFSDDDSAAEDDDDAEEDEDGKPTSSASATPEARPKANEDSDEEYIDEVEERAREEARVQRLIREAEEEAARPSHDFVKRANAILKGGGRQHEETYQLTQITEVSLEDIEQQLCSMEQTLQRLHDESAKADDDTDVTDRVSPEEKLSLTVSKSDFARMRIIGQFNLGFIIASRPSSSSSSSSDLFIIDQHASDEKYNFERLQTSTVLEPQRLVHPRTLSLTAVEEEILLDNLPVLEANGFTFTIDTAGHQPIGQRCTLKTLPTSREVIFDIRDLEELLVLLADHPSSSSSFSSGTTLPRPSKTRRLLASRACRSSIMIGRVLTPAQMARVTAHMGALEKPWNCPHGRPTMRHLLGLGGWRGWTEGEG
ncbi:MAG: hypothetical protein M1817_003282 [Caeruleum heppii]|nr:MAG: hypothetical protein M1817_003282 [Caeruleum heppii]